MEIVRCIYCNEELSVDEAEVVYGADGQGIYAHPECAEDADYDGEDY
jgi:hypothetical protein